MKRIIISFMLLNFAIHSNDLLFDAIRETDLPAVQKLAEKPAIIQQRHIILAKETLALRTQQLLNNSSPHKIPGTSVNKLGLAIGIIGTLAALWHCDDLVRDIRDRYNLDNYYRDLYIARAMVLTFAGISLANAMQLYDKKTKYLENQYKNAQEICFLLDATASNHSTKS